MLYKFPNWYIRSLIVAYTLPFYALLIYTVVVLLNSGFLTLLGGFLGSFVVSTLVFSPIFCIYYAVLTFIHSLINETVFLSSLKKQYIIKILITFVLSLFLALSSIATIQYFEESFGWICFVLMLIGLIATGINIIIGQIVGKIKSNTIC